MSNPVAGVGKAAFTTLVSVRGIRIPLSVAKSSRMALGSGVLVPIPTLSCAKVYLPEIILMAVRPISIKYLGRQVEFFISDGLIRS